LFFDLQLQMMIVCLWDWWWKKQHCQWWSERTNLWKWWW